MGWNLKESTKEAKHTIRAGNIFSTSVSYIGCSSGRFPNVLPNAKAVAVDCNAKTLMKIFSLIISLIIASLLLLNLTQYPKSITSYPIFWIFIVLLVMGILIWLMLKSDRYTTKIASQIEQTRVNEFKKTAEKIILDFDRCEFKNGGYSHEVLDQQLSSLNWASPGSFSYYPTKSERVFQSTLIYSPSRESKERFIGSFPVDSTTLKSYVLTDRICLYVSKQNKAQYLFDIT